MSVVTSGFDTAWSCQKCTLLNNVDTNKCRACDHINSFSGRKLFQKLSSLISTNLEKLDSALDLMSSQIYPSRYSTAFAVNADWRCSNCNRVNGSKMRFCHLCSYDSNNEVSDTNYMSWACDRCALKQPYPPHNSRCPLCRTKSLRLVGRTQSASVSNLSDVVLSPTAESPEYDSTVPRRQSDGASVTTCDDLLANVPTTSKLYGDILKFCTLNNQCFVDDAFPHSVRSIGALNQLECADVDIVWLRPSQIVTRDGRESPWSVFNDPQPSDIEQGALGNCWFLSALAVVAERPDILEKIVITKQYNHFGIYEIRLCVDGIWRSVVVDDFFPCHKSTRTMIFAIGRKNQLWVSLIEKALAKIYGNYSLLRAGRTVEGLSTLTGAPSQIIDLELLKNDDSQSLIIECDLDVGLTNAAANTIVDGPEIDGTQRTAVLDFIWAQLLSAREAHYLMGCSCGAGKRPVNDAEFQRVGLMPRHAYSILDVRQLDTTRLIRLRNPWGKFVWLGEWSANWPGWKTSNLVQRLGCDSSMSGTFWIPFEKFTRYFDSVDIAQIREHDGWTDARYKVDVGWRPVASHVLRLIITEPTEVSVTCFQRNARTLLDQVDIMVAVFREVPPPISKAANDAPFPGELVVRSPRRIQASVRTEDVFLPPGVYVVSAISFAKFAESRSVPATIVIHSAKRVFTELVVVQLNFLRNFMTSIIMKEGKVQQSLDGCIVRYLTNDFAGFAIMVDNFNTNRCVQITSNCHDSMNVLSSRCALFTIDSIPPMHRQIALVLTHFEPSQSFVVGHRLFQRLTQFAQLRDLLPQFPNSQNFPALTTPAMMALHAPAAIAHENC